jgi:hypothetical protein
MINSVRNRLEFTHQYDANCKALVSSTCETTLPDTQIVYNDRHGFTQLRIERMHSEDSIERRSPMFDITYAHANKKHKISPQRSLLEVLAETDDRMVFCGSGRFEAGDKRYVGVDVMALLRRKNLLPLAHELGHVATMAFLTNAVERAIDGSSSVSNEMRPYQPSIEVLSTYARKNPVFAHDWKQIKAEWTANGKTLTPLLHIRPGDRWPYIDRHEDIYLAWNSLAEASAWKKTFEMVEQDKIHPGLNRAGMLAIAHYATSTYDISYETTAYTQALDYALEH